MSDTIDNILDQAIEALGAEPDGYETWALTTDEICKELRPILEKELALAIQLEREKITFDSVVPTWVNEEPAWTLVAIKDGKVIWSSDNPVSKPEVEKLYYIATDKHAGMGGYGLSVSDVNIAAEQMYKDSLSRIC